MISRNDIKLLKMVFSKYGMDYIFSIFTKSKFINFVISHSAHNLWEVVLGITSGTVLKEHQKEIVVYYSIIRGDEKIKNTQVI
mgnify:CR=1 FL=1